MTIRTSNAPASPCQRPTRRDVARRLAAFLSFTLLAALFALSGVAMADPPDSAFTKDEIVLRTVNTMADKRYSHHQDKELKGYPVHKQGDPWVDASTAKVVHKVDPKTNVPNPTMADVIWKGKSKEGIPYYFKSSFASPLGNRRFAARERTARRRNALPFARD
jgi:hypothetical protein